MNFSGPRSRRAVLMDLTPLIDVVFLLLIFFMVTTTFDAQPGGMEVDLPRSENREAIPEGEDISIEIDQDGSIAVNEQPVDLDGLRAALREAARTDPSTLVILRADEVATHGRVVQVMDLARDLGLSKFAIATDSLTSGRGAGTQD